MSELVEVIPNPKAAFRFDGDADQFELDVFEAVVEMSKIMTACKDKELQGTEYLAGFIQWVQQASGKELTLGQANKLWDMLQLRAAQEKKDYLDTLKSLTSSE